ncbi:unnamed protein product [Nyctereutes procyonoides]|uniref:(raccoon dog) hypothetical protein n=1 Tax=Nyctereutes procyonoides TaxID=34880 RepID=A0A811YR43_NYCPR|nr:unnamed protein product [Nyctereutes procyonoides]
MSKWKAQQQMLNGEITNTMNQAILKKPYKIKSGTEIDEFLVTGKFSSINFLTQKVHFITDALSKGETKFIGDCQLPSKNDEKEYPHRRIDRRLLPKDQYYHGVLYFTRRILSKDIFGYVQWKYQEPKDQSG